jgi:benzoyl-CoA reductase/2-hydroxyglutaryl-CoA dehydratase subunit BcrC/BadD/HgdB
VIIQKKSPYKQKPESTPFMRVDFATWNELFQNISEKVIKRYKYYKRKEDWARYLSPPQTFAIYGLRHLRRLKFDSSLECLRLWGFIFNETERLFRAKQINKKIIAVMGDLGGIPVLIYSFKDLIGFYPDCLWWQPFFSENYNLFEVCGRANFPETSCYSRVIYATFLKKAYFPKPDLIIASTGASCDDYSCVMQAVYNLYKKETEFIWLEIPPRKERKELAIKLLKENYQKVAKILSEIAGKKFSWEKIFLGIKKVNRIRKNYLKLKELVGKSELAPLGALEMLMLEFGNLHFYSDIEEWDKILFSILKLVKKRIKEKIGVLKKDSKKIVWVTPPADPLYLTYFEDLGARIVGSEYLINQALTIIPLKENPFLSLAESYLSASLIGKSEERAKLIIEQVKKYQAKGVVITQVFGASHCAYETEILREEIIKKAKVPVLVIDIPLPATDIPLQQKVRISAFLENL